MKNKILENARKLQPKLVEVRRDLHQHPEIGFDLSYTKEKVKTELQQMGIETEDCGKAGLTALLGDPSKGKTLLFRADMDALLIEEQSGVEFSSLHEGKMHACGHDMHTTMLLGAAKLLKQEKNSLAGAVKLMFQPAEEIFQGALDMIEAGVLETPSVDAAMMLHVATQIPAPSGTLLVPCGQYATASCEQYHICVTGKGGHGAMLDQVIDPITAAAAIHLELQKIECEGVFSTGKFQAGNASNIIPNEAKMWGTIRTLDATERAGNEIKRQIREVVNRVATAHGCTAEVSFFDYCPSFVIEKALALEATEYAKELFGPQVQPFEQAGWGSEDFAFVSNRVPSITFHLAAGNEKEGYPYQLHHPKVRLNEEILWRGSALYAYEAIRILEN